MIIDDELIDPSVEPSDEKIYRLIQSTLSCIPVIGGVFQIFHEASFPSPMQRRAVEWKLQVTKAINTLSINVERLECNQVFISTLIKATEVAIKSHETEKLNAIKAAVCNSAVDPTNVVDTYCLFLNLIDRFTPLHLKVLSFFRDKKAYISMIESTTKDELDFFIAQKLNISKEFYLVINQDLMFSSLIDAPDFAGIFNGILDGEKNNASFTKVTEFGCDFLDFIKEI